MLFKFRYFVLIFLLSLLAISISMVSDVQVIQGLYAAESDEQLCEVENNMSYINVSEGLDPDNIAFLNWNIYKGNGEGWQKDLSFFAKKHDLMTIQEAVLDDELVGLLNSHDFNWIMNTAFYLKGDASGVMTVANFDASHSCGFHVKEPLIRLPKSTLVSYYPINDSDEKLLVANIHSVNFTLGMSVYRKQLKKLYELIEQHEGPMIVAGDFNSWSKERFVEVAQLIEMLSLSELDHSVNKTHVFGNAIDHVFYRRLELVSQQVHQVSSSDHNPISVNFRLQPAI